MKRNAALCICLTLLLTVLSGCYYALEEDNSFSYVSNSMGRDAFVYQFLYDGSQISTITIPETMDGYQITALGGHMSSGPSAPFHISLDRLDLTTSYIADASYFADFDPETTEVHYYDFNLIIGANIHSIYAEALTAAFERSSTESVVHIPRVYITCSEDNPNFYSNDGKLYHKDGALVEGFFYHDQLLFA